MGNPFQGGLDVIKSKMRKGMGDNSDSVKVQAAYSTLELLWMGKESMNSTQLIANSENLKGWRKVIGQGSLVPVEKKDVCLTWASWFLNQTIPKSDSYGHMHPRNS